MRMKKPSVNSMIQKHDSQISFSWVSHENEKTVRQQYETKTRFSNLILMGVP
jgi:hypothetical protein